MILEEQTRDVAITEVLRPTVTIAEQCLSNHTLKLDSDGRPLIGEIIINQGKRTPRFGFQ